jgi:hypothetical protein
MKRPPNNVMSEIKTRQKSAKVSVSEKKVRNVWGIHEDFETVFNAVLISGIVMRRSL